MLSWTPNYIAHLPLHEQLVRFIHKNLGKGGFEKNDRLPPISKVSSKLAVSKAIIEAAYKELQNQGIIAPVPEHETFVILKEAN